MTATLARLCPQALPGLEGKLDDKLVGRLAETPLDDFWTLQATVLEAIVRLEGDCPASTGAFVHFLLAHAKSLSDQKSDEYAPSFLCYGLELPLRFVASCHGLLGPSFLAPDQLLGLTVKGSPKCLGSLLEQINGSPENAERRPHFVELAALYAHLMRVHHCLYLSARQRDNEKLDDKENTLAAAQDTGAISSLQKDLLERIAAFGGIAESLCETYRHPGALCELMEVLQAEQVAEIVSPLDWELLQRGFVDADMNLAIFRNSDFEEFGKTDAGEEQCGPGADEGCCQAGGQQCCGDSCEEGDCGYDDDWSGSGADRAIDPFQHLFLQYAKSQSYVSTLMLQKLKDHPELQEFGTIAAVLGINLVANHCDMQNLAAAKFRAWRIRQELQGALCKDANVAQQEAVVAEYDASLVDLLYEANAEHSKASLETFVGALKDFCGRHGISADAQAQAICHLKALVRHWSQTDFEMYMYQHVVSMIQNRPHCQSDSCCREADEDACCQDGAPSAPCCRQGDTHSPCCEEDGEQQRSSFPYAYAQLLKENPEAAKRLLYKGYDYEPGSGRGGVVHGGSDSGAEYSDDDEEDSEEHEEDSEEHEEDSEERDEDSEERDEDSEERDEDSEEYDDCGRSNGGSDQDSAASSQFEASDRDCGGCCGPNGGICAAPGIGGEDDPEKLQDYLEECLRELSIGA